MSLRKWARLFWKTMLVGAVGAVIAGLVLQFATGTIQFKGAVDMLIYPLILLGYGALVSVYSQLGFFAYLTLNYMGVGVFKRKTWEYIQIVLSVLALLELMFLRTFVGGEQNLTWDLTLGIGILITAIIVTYLKVRYTNILALIPTMFFMLAITILEIIGVLKIGVNNATVFIIIPLLACNAYQILTLHKVTQDEKKS
ncbi:KinB-signaling pathway activation protein [Paenibacillus sp. N3/727]|uniref:KinB-signaling pathway activation protein n=1 Tax=Paenibacillus sp. N3/727 TaxID=2925845 RepID=UPI001F52C23F|nr:KinB-signaling pathway activation protein [Paenibacillus sp. N3/727]UNK17925.1 KinB-signaling pathway activation protein [Paenibacillus sp. N3/727]